MCLLLLFLLDRMRCYLQCRFRGPRKRKVQVQVGGLPHILLVTARRNLSHEHMFEQAVLYECNYSCYTFRPKDWVCISTTSLIEFVHF